jgi:poly(3-hydroxybutyrate) depolymerase
VPSDIRVGKAVLAAHRLMKQHAIDPDRVYVSGFSGGARTACIAAFYQPDLFRGAIPMAGAMYPVSTEYGSFQADAPAVAAAQQRVRFAIIAHQGDYRYKDIMAVYNQGFRKNAFQATTVQVPGKKHGYASADSMQEALKFVEAAAPPPSEPPKAPKQMPAKGNGR